MALFTSEVVLALLVFQVSMSSLLSALRISAVVKGKLPTAETIALSRSDDFVRESEELREPILFPISLSGSLIVFDGGTEGTDSNESSNESRLKVRDSQQEESSTGSLQYRQLSFF